MHSSRFSRTISTLPFAALKMSTGQASSSFLASSASSRISSETATSMNMPWSSCVSANLRPRSLPDRVRDLVDPLDYRDPGGFEPLDFLGGGVLGALDDGA